MKLFQGLLTCSPSSAFVKEGIVFVLPPTQNTPSLFTPTHNVSLFDLAQMVACASPLPSPSCPVIYVPPFGSKARCRMRYGRGGGEWVEGEG